MAQGNIVLNGLLGVFNMWLPLRLFNYNFHLFHYFQLKRRGSSVGTATRYGLGGPGIESRWELVLQHQFRPTLGPTPPLYTGYRVIPVGKAAGPWR
jgi:hypothetical protein